MKQLKHLLNKKSLNLYLGFVIKAFFIRQLISDLDQTLVETNTCFKILWNVN
jgi:hypothetical protein